VIVVGMSVDFAGAEAAADRRSERSIFSNATVMVVDEGGFGKRQRGCIRG